VLDALKLTHALNDRPEVSQLLGQRTVAGAIARLGGLTELLRQLFVLTLEFLEFLVHHKIPW